MKKNGWLPFLLVLGGTAFPQDALFIHRSDRVTLGVPLSRVEALRFDAADAAYTFDLGDSLVRIPFADVDSLSFGADSDTIAVTYDDARASVINPRAFDGVSVRLSGADVDVTSVSENKNLGYRLSGHSTAGAFRLGSEKRCTLVFDGVTLANPGGPAVEIQGGKKTSVLLRKGTASSLADGAEYADSVETADGNFEDRKAAFFSEGPLVFGGSGALAVHGTGSGKHGVCSDDSITIEGGKLTVTAAAKDGIHANDGIRITDGTVVVASSGDGLDGGNGPILVSGGSVTAWNTSADARGIVSDSVVSVSGGVLDLTVSGDRSRGIQAGTDMTLNGGSVTVRNSGGASLAASGSGFEPTYCTGLRAGGRILLSGTAVTVTSTGTAGRGLSADGDILVTGGSVNLSTSGAGVKYTDVSGTANCYHAACMNADGSISILAGLVTASSSGSAGTGITADGGLTVGGAAGSPIVSVATTGTSVTLSQSGGGGWGGGGFGQTADAAEAKAVRAGGAVSIRSGSITIASADDGVKSTTSVTIDGGSVVIRNATEGIEAPLITVNGGTVDLAASDDGFNATRGSGGEADDGSRLVFNGGVIRVNTTTGDGLDSNGGLSVTGGTIVVQGPRSQPEVGLDVNGTTTVSGGLLAVSGIYSNMTEGPGSGSTQCCVLVTSRTTFGASTLFHIQDAGGADLLTFKPVRDYSSMIFSSPALKTGSSYTIYTGGSSTGTDQGGLVTGGAYSGGSLKKTFTIGSRVTTVSL
jgi:trimeric autotransporter adhesin